MPTELYTLLLLLAAAMTAFLACQRLQASLATGYMLVGMVLGPCGFSFVQKTPFLDVLGELGILLLLFTMGLELPFHRLRALRRKIFGLGLVQVIGTTLLLYGIFSYFPLLRQSGSLLILSLILSFSSTAIIVQLLSESFELTTHLGRLCLAILLFQDMVAIGLFVYLSMMQQSVLTPFLTSIGLLSTVPLCWLLTAVTDKLFSAYRCYEATMPFVLLALLGMSILTYICGLSAELGAFAAGIAMASTHWRHQIHTELHPFRSLFMAIFFMAMGLEVDLGSALGQLDQVMMVLMALLCAKVAVIFVSGSVSKLHWVTKAPLAALIFGGSEFLFVIIPTLSLDPALKQVLLVSGFVSMLMTPLCFFLIRSWVQRQTEGERSIKPQIIIAGFGQMGQTIAHILEKNFIAFLIIDHDTGRVAEALDRNYSALMGDMRDLEFLKRVGIAHARALLITYRTTCIDFIQSLRQKFPVLEVGMLVTDYMQASQFSDVGVHLIIPEAVDSGMQMAIKALQFLGFSEKQRKRMVRFPKVPAFLGSTTR